MTLTKQNKLSAVSNIKPQYKFAVQKYYHTALLYGSVTFLNEYIMEDRFHLAL